MCVNKLPRVKRNSSRSRTRYHSIASPTSDIIKTERETVQVWQLLYWTSRASYRSYELWTRMHICKNACLGTSLSSQCAISRRYRQMGMPSRCAATQQLRHVHRIMHTLDDATGHLFPSVSDVHRLVRKGENGLWENTTDNIPPVSYTHLTLPTKRIV